jgi:ABC-type branched-subunit amino acid transport system substrate-binding protein
LRVSRLGVFGAVLALAVTACGANSSSSNNSSEPIKIGVTGPFSGNYAAPGIDIQNAAKVMADQFNKSGGIMGRKVQIVPGDDQCDAQVGVQAAENLVSQKVVAFAGGYCSGASIPETDVLKKHGGIPFLGVASSNPKLTEQGYPNVFRIVIRDDQEGPQDASFLMDQLKAKKISILHDNSTYAKALAEFARDKATKSGGTVTYYDALTPGQKDYTSAITRVASGNPDAFLFTGYYAEAATLLKEYKDLGLDKKFIFMGGGGNFDPALLTAAGASANGMYVLFPVGPETAKGKEFDDFKAAYTKSTGKDPATYSIYEHDAMVLTKMAIEKANSTKPADINKALHELSYDGITGPIKFDSKGDRQELTEIAFQVTDNKFMPLFKSQKGQWVKFS